jgi:probable phosphoglycerate mutase
LSFGEWEDRLPTEVDPAALRRWELDPALYSPPGGETGLEVLARAVAAVRDAAGMAAEAAAQTTAQTTAARRRSPGTVAVVAHKAPIRLVLSFFLGLPPSRYRDIANVAVGSISRLTLHEDEGRASLLALGDVSHLPPEWRMNPDLAAWPTRGGPWPIDG